MFGVPTRTCVGCRATDDQGALVRVVRTASGYQVSRTAPGRGAWLHPGCGQKAVRRRALQRALRGEQHDPDAVSAVAAAVDARVALGQNEG